MILAVIDFIAAIPIFVFDWSTFLPVLVLDICMVVVMVLGKGDAAHKASGKNRERQNSVQLFHCELLAVWMLTNKVALFVFHSDYGLSGKLSRCARKVGFAASSKSNLAKTPFSGRFAFMSTAYSFWMADNSLGTRLRQLYRVNCNERDIDGFVFSTTSALKYSGDAQTKVCLNQQEEPWGRPEFA
jgi:hypothetical protein